MTFLEVATNLSDTQKIFLSSILTISGSILISIIVYFLGLIAKSREIKLSNYYKDRIEVVKVLYSHIVELKYCNDNLFNSEYSSLNHEQYQNLLNAWLNKFYETRLYYNKNRILLVDNSTLSKQIQDSLIVLFELSFIIRKEVRLGNSFDYDSMDDEVSSTGKRHHKLITENELPYAVHSFEKIRQDLETYFKRLV